MSFRIVITFIAGLFFVPSLHAQPPAKPRTDFYGDPLPDGAIAKLGTLKTATRKERANWEGHRDYVDHVAFSTDGKRLISNSAQSLYQAGEVITWDSVNWKRLQFTPPGTSKWPNIGLRSLDNTLFMGHEANDRFSIYSLDTGKLVYRLDPLSTGKLSTKFGYLSSCSRFFLVPENRYQSDYNTNLFDLSSGKLISKLPDLDFWAFMTREWRRPFAFSKDGGLIALVARKGQQLRLYETATGKLLHRLSPEVNDNNHSVDFEFSFSPDGKQLAVWKRKGSSDPELRIWDVVTGKTKGQLPLFGGTIHEAYLAWSPDGRTLAVADRDKIYLWELSSQKLRHIFKGHEGDILSIAFSPDGRLLASGSADTTVLIWDVWGR